MRRVEIVLLFYMIGLCAPGMVHAQYCTCITMALDTVKGTLLRADSSGVVIGDVDIFNEANTVRRSVPCSEILMLRLNAHRTNAACIGGIVGFVLGAGAMLLHNIQADDRDFEKKGDALRYYIMPAAAGLAAGVIGLLTGAIIDANQDDLVYQIYGNRFAYLAVLTELREMQRGDE